MSKKYKKILLEHELSLLDNGNLQDHTHQNSRSVILLGDSLDTQQFTDILLSSSNNKLSKTLQSKWFKKHRVQFHIDQLLEKFPQLLSSSPKNNTNENENEKSTNNINNNNNNKNNNNNNLFTTVYRPVSDDELKHLLQTNQLPSTQPYQAIMADEAGRQYAERYVDGTKRVDTSPSTVIEIVAPTFLIQKLFERQQKPEEGCLSHGLGFAAGKDLPMMNEWLGVFSSGKVMEVIDEYDERLFIDDDDEKEAENDTNDVEEQKLYRPIEDIFEFRRAWRIVKVKRKIPS